MLVRSCGRGFAVRVRKHTDSNSKSDVSDSSVPATMMRLDDNGGQADSMSGKRQEVFEQKWDM